MPLRVFSPHIPAYYKRPKSLSPAATVCFYFPALAACPDFITDYFKAGEILG